MVFMSRFKTGQLLRYIRRPFEIVILQYLFSLMLIVPILMFMVWILWPQQELNIVLINKSVPDESRTEHASINWLLKHDQIVNSQGESYQIDTDYYGFFPQADSGYTIRDFNSYDTHQFDRLVELTDIVYSADAYGVYSHNYHGDLSLPNRLIYGGLQMSDVTFLKKMYDHGKLVISEFSLFGAPTSSTVKDSLESIFGIEWSGWIGRYFISLDTTANDALPHWVVKLYQDDQGLSWPFKDSGIVLVKGSEILILEYGTHLDLETPVIETQSVYSEKYGLPESIPYPFWFDIVSSPTRDNQVLSIFHLPVNAEGEKLLRKHGIPTLFPAVLHEISDQHRFFYFAGDFSDNPVFPVTAYFKGISWFQSFLYNSNEIDDRRQFFWRYYRPLITTILREEFQRKQ